MHPFFAAGGRNLPTESAVPSELLIKASKGMIVVTERGIAFYLGGAGMAQWGEHSPPTNVARVRFRPYVGTICGLSLLLVLVLAPRVFLRVLRFSSLRKNQHC